MSRFDGKTQRRRFKKLRLDEISLVDLPAHTQAQVAILKRRSPDELAKRMALTTPVAGHAHSIIMVSGHGEGLAELRAGQTSYSEGHVHDWIMDDAGNIILAEAMGHTHGIGALVTKEQVQGLVAALESETAKAETGNPAEDDPGNTTTSKDHPTMTQKNEDAVKVPEAVQKQLDELTQKNERLAAIVSLSPEQRAHFDTLKGEAQDEFLATEDKDAVIKNAESEDPVVYKTLSGRELRKSAGEDMIEMAKELDAEKRQNLANQAIAKRADLVKRAGEELEHLTGSNDAKADLLGAVESLPTEKRGPVLEILKSKDAGMQKAFSEVGTSDDGNGQGIDAHQKIEGIAKRLREADANLTPAQAYVKALETPEGRELHAQLIG